MGRERAVVDEREPVTARDEVRPRRAAWERWLPLSVLAGCVAVFVALSLDVTHEGAIARLDLRIAPWVSRHVAGELHAWAWRLTHPGDFLVLTFVVIAGAAVLVAHRRRLDAVLLVLASALVAVVTTATKEAFGRSRPPFLDASHQLHSFSFPSGHSSGAFAVYTLTALLLTVGMSARVRAVALAGALVLASLVAATRVVIPAHYLSDVIAGAALGLAIATGVWSIHVAATRR